MSAAPAGETDYIETARFMILRCEEFGFPSIDIVKACSHILYEWAFSVEALEDRLQLAKEFRAVADQLHHGTPTGGAG